MEQPILASHSTQSRPATSAPWYKFNPAMVMGLGTVAVVAIVMVACLDMPISGTVANESMGYAVSQWTVANPVISIAPEGRIGTEQLVLSDVPSSCRQVELLAAPGQGSHTLAFSLSRADGTSAGEGVYSVGAGDTQDAVAATFVYQRGTRVVETYATSGELELTSVTDGLAQGYFHVSFPEGTLEGVFNSERCDE